MKFLRDITEFIFLEDLPKKADIIIVPGQYMAAACKEGCGAVSGRGWHLILWCLADTAKTGRLLRGHPVTGKCYKGPYAAEADFLTDVLMQAGVPGEAILQEREATFTLENAEYIRKMLEEKHLPIKRAIICCQAFHARRCRMYFEYVFQDREIEFLMCPAVTQGISRDNWAESKKGLETVLGELRRCGEQFSWMLQ